MNVQIWYILSTYPPFKLNAFDTTGPWAFEWFDQTITRISSDWQPNEPNKASGKIYSTTAGFSESTTFGFGSDLPLTNCATTQVHFLNCSLDLFFVAKQRWYMVLHPQSQIVHKLYIVFNCFCVFSSFILRSRSHVDKIKNEKRAKTHFKT